MYFSLVLISNFREACACALALPEQFADNRNNVISSFNSAPTSNFTLALSYLVYVDMICCFVLYLEVSDSPDSEYTF